MKKKKIVIAKALLQDRSWVTPNPVFEFFTNVLFIAFAVLLFMVLVPVYFVAMMYNKVRWRQNENSRFK